MRTTLTLLLLVAACTTPAPGRTNVKGWELYCRKTDANAQVIFVLLPGTNRLKTIEEIEGAPDAATGLAGARRLFQTLASGQMVVCSLPRLPDAAERGYFCPSSHTDFGRALRKHAEACRVELEGPRTW